MAHTQNGSHADGLRALCPQNGGNFTLLDGADAQLSTSRYAKLSSCSLDTALRDIKLLLDAGILAPGPGGGRSTKYELQSPPETTT